MAECIVIITAKQDAVKDLEPILHGVLLKELGKITIKQSYIDLFEQILKDHDQRNLKEDKATASSFDIEIEKSKTRIASAQQLMLDGELDASDYTQIKSRYEGKIAR